MQSYWLDVTTALRFFARRKATSAAIILTMALALAANTTAFAVLNAFLFGNLAIPDSDRVVVIPTPKSCRAAAGSTSQTPTRIICC